MGHLDITDGGPSVGAMTWMDSGTCECLMAHLSGQVVLKQMEGEQEAENGAVGR